MDTGQSWIDQFRELLCQMYREWGGDCDDLGLNATAWIDTLQGEYDTKGAPTFQSETERQAYLGLLNTTEAHLNASGNSLNAADNAQIRTLISNLRADVQSQPT